MSVHQLSENWEQVFPLSPAGQVTVEQGAGKVEVRSWPRDEVKLQAIRYGRATVEAHGRGDRVHIEVGSGRWFSGAGRADLTLWVPRQAQVTVDAASGDIEIQDVLGSVKIDTLAGNISARNIGSLEASTASGAVRVVGAAGPVRIDVASGRVEVSAVSGDVNIDTGSGEVSVTDVRGSVMVDTGSGGVEVTGVRGTEVVVDSGGGRVRLRQIDCRRIHVDNGTGPVEAQFAVWDGGSYDFETGSGGIDLAIPAYSRCSIVAEAGTVNAITCDLPLIGKRIGPESLTGVLNDNRSRVFAQTSGGQIRITPAEFSDAWPEEGRGKSPAPAREPLSEEYLKVLKMVEEGKLTPDEAEALLEAMESPEEVSESNRHVPESRGAAGDSRGDVSESAGSSDSPTKELE